MYLTKPQYKAIIAVNVGKHDQVGAEIIQFLIDNGQIFETLIGYDLTDAGRQSLSENFVEHQQQKADVKTGPSGKGEFHKEKRTVFSADDDLTVTKRKSTSYVPKAKPDTKYK